MAYQSNEELPEAIRQSLPEAGQDIFRRAYNHAVRLYPGREPVATAVAWEAVRRRYLHTGEGWEPMPAAAAP